MNKEKEIMEIARKALLQEKAYVKATQKPSILMEATEKFKNADFAKNLYEPYDEITFEGKVAIDLLYYKHLLRNLDESYSKDVQELIAQTYRTVKSIYEFVNIKPITFGKDIDSSILENSIEKVEKRLSTVLIETIDNLFYSLSPEKRIDKYSDRAIPLAKKLVLEHNNPEESLQFSIKSCVLEDVLVKIAFPGVNWLRVTHLTESEDFGLIFDQQKLVDLVETFSKQVKKLSNYLAVSV
jgi:hemerythrin superfamily protein